MPTVTVHYDGWVMLPVRLARSFGLQTGDRLSVELEGERIVLSRATNRDAELAASTAAPAVAAPSAKAEPEPIPEEATRKARGRRKRQTAVAEGQG